MSKFNLAKNLKPMIIVLTFLGLLPNSKSIFNTIRIIMIHAFFLFLFNLSLLIKMIVSFDDLQVLLSVSYITMVTLDGFIKGLYIVRYKYVLQKLCNGIEKIDQKQISSKMKYWMII